MERISTDCKSCCVIYARVSTVEQEREGYSIQAQLKMLREYSDTHGMEVLKEFTDNETARSTGRANFNRMLAFLEEHPDCKDILVEKTDRLTRNQGDFIALNLERSHLRVHMVREGKILSHESSPAEFFIQDIQIAQAAFVSRNISAEARKGMQAKAEMGIYPSYAPLGYLNTIGKCGRKVITPDPERAHLIVRLFAEYAKKACSVNDLVALSQGIGLRSRKGKVLSPSTIHKMLKNPVYKGVVQWRNSLYQGIHEPLVSTGLWHEVQLALTGGNNRKCHRERHAFAFSGLIKCAVCGCSLTGDLKKGKYVYYHCSGYKGKHGEPYTREEVFEERFAEVLQRLVPDDDVVEWIVETVTEESDENISKQREIISGLENLIVKQERKLELLYDDRLEGRIDAQTYDRKSSEIREELNGLRASLDTLIAQDASDLPQTCAETFELAKYAFWMFLTSPDAEKHNLLKRVLSNCTWSQGEMKVEYSQSLGIIADTNAIWRDLKAENPDFSDFHSVWYGILNRVITFFVPEYRMNE
ncbi:MAG: recombinase family protein [Candidatus Aegiribacteria sp.]|nr:recombinase family protein [Candidatus Aegiribacteria sp.]